MKKLLSYLLVIALVLVQFMPLVSAAETTGKIKITTPESETVNGAIKYNIYKIFDLSLNADATAYRYTIKENSLWYEFFKTGAGKDYVSLELSVPEKDANGDSINVYVVTWTGSKTESNMATLAKAALTYAKATKIAATETATIAQGGTETTVTGLELGYYLVDSSLGALVALTTTDRTGEINEKNTPPTIDKDIMEENTEFDKNNNEDIGDVVNYRVTIEAKKGAQNYVLTDTMTNGLTFNKDVVVKVGETALAVNKDYSVVLGGANDGFTFKVEFKKAYLDTITTDTNIVVTYSATINENAVINGEGNINKAKLTYGDGTDTNWSETRTYVLAFDLFKTDAQGTTLDGAEFELYDALTGGNKINLVKVTPAEGQPYYRVATAEEEQATNFTSAIIQVGNARIEGLDEGTYYLQETKAPEGYNRLTSRIEIKLTDTVITAGGFEHKTVVTTTVDNKTAVTENDDIKIKNYTGSLLPSTGGMGTVMFITVGSIMVLGFGVLLVTKLRISKMEI